MQKNPDGCRKPPGFFLFPVPSRILSKSPRLIGVLALNLPKVEFEHFSVYPEPLEGFPPRVLSESPRLIEILVLTLPKVKATFGREVETVNR